MKGSALDQMNYAVSHAPQVLGEIKDKTGRRLIASFVTLAPREIIYAAGAHPAILIPYSREAITAADFHLQTFICSILRSIWDEVLKGKYSYLDGVVIPTSCEAVKFLYQTFERHNPYNMVAAIVTPFKKGEEAVGFLAQELGKFKKTLENFMGKEISDDSLSHAISIYNRNRELLKKVYELRKASPPLISGTEAHNVVMSGFIYDPEEHNKMLEQLLSQVEERQAPSEEKVRLLVSGGCFIEREILEMIESAGASVVVDDTNTGSRSFWHMVDLSENPLKALARSYIKTPSASITTAEDRLKYIRDMVVEYRVDGVLFAIQKYCESEKFDLPLLEKQIKGRAVGVPTTFIETDYPSSLAPLRTRVEAFIESLQYRKGG